VDRRSPIDRRLDVDGHGFMKLGWCVTDTAESLFPELEMFVCAHRPHRTLTSDATEPVWNGYLLTVACACGVVFGRWVTPQDAEVDLMQVAEQS